MKQAFDIEFRQLQLEPYQFLQLIFIQQAVRAQGSQVWKKRLQNEYIICNLAMSGYAISISRPAGILKVPRNAVYLLPPFKQGKQ